MIKYISRPSAWWTELSHINIEASSREINAIEEDGRPQPTGLLDAHGNALFRVQEKRVIGFYELREDATKT